MMPSCHYSAMSLRAKRNYFVPEERNDEGWKTDRFSGRNSLFVVAEIFDTMKRREGRNFCEEMEIL